MMKLIKCCVYPWTILLLLVVILAVFGCGSGSGSANGSKDGRGGLSFQLAWGTGSSRENVTQASKLVSGDVCADYRIEEIHIQAIDQSGIERKKAMWPCGQRQGELSEVPVGTYRLILQGEVAGEMAWRGEVTEVQVQKDQETDAGVVAMTHMHDNSAPTVVQTIPADNATQVPTNISLTATFDGPIVAQSIDTQNFKLAYTDNGGSENSVDCTVEYDADNYIAVITPAQALLDNTTFVATIVIDQSPIVEDIAGNPMEEAVQWTFTTIGGDVEAPQVRSTTPAHGQMDVIRDTSIQIEFSEPVNSLTITTDSIYLHCDDNLVPSNVTYDSQNYTATLATVSGMPEATTCTVTATADITDLASNPMTEDESRSFVTQFPPWHAESVVGLTAGESTSIALTSSEAPYVSCVNSGRHTFALRDPFGVWSTSTQAEVSGLGKNQDMVLGPGDTRHIAYTQASVFHLDYGRAPLGGIGMGVNIGSGKSCNGIAVATDDTNKGHLCWYDTDNLRLRYVNEASGWTAQDVDHGSGEYPSMVVAPSGKVHIAYYDRTNSNLKYAVKAPGSAWAVETVDAGTNVGLYTDIAVDASGNPHISYYDQYAGDLKYATLRSSGTWSKDTVDSEGVVGAYSSIDLDTSGRAHFSYHDESHTALKYATRTALGWWYTHTLDSTVNTGFATAIAVDSQDHVHVSYRDEHGHYLKYATTRPQLSKPQ